MLLTLAVFSTSPVFADAGLPGVVDVQEHLGATISRDIELQDEYGKTITMGEILTSNRPVVLVLAYYRCPMLCPLVLNGMTQGLREAGLAMGNDYRLVTVSIDPEDTPVDARKRKDSLRTKLGSEIETGASFLVGRAEETRALADSVGFRYVFDAATDQYAHPAVAVILGSSGRISRYIYGPEPSPRDLRLA
ncbi:MAG TPA: SCO family protein, partial [Polyangium sp.]|nr:SCO family protein [Polyangium sp.]